MKIKKWDEVSYWDLGVKRLYVPFIVEWDCPECKEKNTTNYGDGWQPICTEEPIEKWSSEYLYCNNCDYEKHFKYKVSLSMEIEQEE